MKTKIISILALLLTMTQGAWAQTVNCLPSDIGKVLGTDGKVYATVDAAGGMGNVSGMIAYVNGTTGIAIGPSDLLWNSSDGSQKMPVSTANSACDGYTKTRPSAATTGWRLPSQADFNNMIGANGCESANNLRNMIGRQASSCGCYAMQTDEGYWSSTLSGSGVYYNLWANDCNSVASEANEKYVRPCFTFNVTPNYTISFNANGGSGSVASQTKFEDTDITLPSSGFTRDGYTFNGWNTAADGSGNAYAAGATYSANADVTLYAQWTCNTTTSGIDWNPSTNSGTFLMPAYNVEVSTELWYILKQNGETPADNKTKADVFLERTLSNSMWSTFCAPFDAAIPDGWTVKKFTGSGYNASTQTLTLDFTTAESIVAGTPYLVKADVDGPTFEGVSQDWTAYNEVTPSANGGYATFVPVLTPTTLNANDKTKLYLGGENTLYYPSKNVQVKGFRAYFQLNDLTAGDLPNTARAFVLNIDGEQTGIRSLTPDASPKGEGSIYSLDGRKVQNTTRKGVYIKNGRKVVIK